MSQPASFEQADSFEQTDSPEQLNSPKQQDSSVQPDSSQQTVSVAQTTAHGEHLLQQTSVWLQQQPTGQHQAQYQHFWQFSLEQYPAWQQQLLQLQDHYQAQVNVLLLLAFMARPASAISDSPSTRSTGTPDAPYSAGHSTAQPWAEATPATWLKALQQAAAPTQQQLLPLRALRRLLDKTQAAQAELRQRLLTLELAIEQLEQQRLIDAWLALTDTASASPACSNSGRLSSQLTNQQYSKYPNPQHLSTNHCDDLPQTKQLAAHTRVLLDCYLDQLQLPNRSEIQQLLLG